MLSYIAVAVVIADSCVTKHSALSATFSKPSYAKIAVICFALFRRRRLTQKARLFRLLSRLI
jgi:hypothetical protein